MDVKAPSTLGHRVPTVHRTHHWCYSAAAGSSLSHGQGASSILPTAYPKRVWNITPVQPGLQKTSPLCLNPPLPATRHPCSGPCAHHACRRHSPCSGLHRCRKAPPLQQLSRGFQPYLPFLAPQRPTPLTDIAAWRFHFENGQPSKQLAGYWLELSLAACTFCSFQLLASGDREHPSFTLKQTPWCFQSSLSAHASLPYVCHVCMLHARAACSLRSTAVPQK